MSDVITLKGSNTEGSFKELKAQYLRGEITLKDDKESLYNAAMSPEHYDHRFATLLWYDYRFDFYVNELANGTFVQKPSVVQGLKRVAAIKGMDSVKQINQALATCDKIQLNKGQQEER